MVMSCASVAGLGPWKPFAAGFAAGVLIMGVAYAVTAEQVIAAAVGRRAGRESARALIGHRHCGPRPLEHVRCVWVVSQ